MKRNIITTADGSSTIQIEEWNEQYHSVHGAIQEANHVYIKHGFLFGCNLQLENGEDSNLLHDDTENIAVNAQNNPQINILEIGFGTGLNALLTFIKAKEIDQPVHYVGVEAFPIASEELSQLNYADKLQIDTAIFKKMHDVSWDEMHQISEVFSLKKQKKRFEDISEENKFDVIYFDAFGPRVQPELWTESIFRIMFNALKSDGILTTYSAKGSVRRAMQAVGLEVERLEGPPGKREMLRGRKWLSQH